MHCPSCQAANADSAGVCLACGKPLRPLMRGTVLARRYEIVEPLGSGGMGVVYKAHDLQLDEMVALKVLRADIAAQSARRFTSEIKLARKVRHRNVCAIHEYHEEGSLRFIAMELIEGVDLRRILKERGALPPQEAYDVALQVALGLEAIHEVGIVHRDLKTSNLMRDARGVVRLMDFGIAKELDGPDAAALTAAGQIVGTPEYMSPEQAQGRRIDSRSDLYALGIVMFELFTGAVPFRGPTPVSTLFKHVREPPPLEGPRGAQIPPELLAILRKALAKEPDQRFATAKEMADALREAREQSAAGKWTAGGVAGPLDATATWPATTRPETQPDAQTVTQPRAAAPTAPSTTLVPVTTASRPQVTPSAERPRRAWLLVLSLATVALLLGGLLGSAYLRVSRRQAAPASAPRSTPSPASATPPSAPTAASPESAPTVSAAPASPAFPSPPVMASSAPPRAVEPPVDAAPAVFVPGATTFTPASVTPRGFGNPPPGFEIKPAQPPAPRAQLVIEATPSVIRPGDSYVLRYSLLNMSAAPLTIGAVALHHTPAGSVPSGGAVEPLSRAARPQSRTLLCETRGTWGQGDPAGWTTTLTVVLDDGSIYASTLRARRP